MEDKNWEFIRRQIVTGYLLSVVFFFKPNTSPFRNNDNSQERKEKRTLINEIKAVTLVDPEES